MKKTRKRLTACGWFWLTYIGSMVLLSWVLYALFAPNTAHARRNHHEKWYQQAWCSEHNGRTEVVLADRTRCDCLTSSHAIEFDFADKWEEAIGQSLYYSLQTGKKAGIVLILEKPKDMRYWIRLNSVILNDGLDIDTWMIGPGNNK